MQMNRFGRPACFLILLSFSLSGCASFSRRSQEEKNEESRESRQTSASGNHEAGSTGKTTGDLTALEISRLHTRIEELEAKLAGLTDSMSALRTSVDNVIGPKDLRTVGVGSNADGVAVASGNTESRAQKVVTSQEIKSLGTKNLEVSSVNASAAGGSNGEDAFATAMNSFRRSQFSEAVLAFSEFAGRNPSALLAPSALYYAGESYYMLKQYKLAIPEYQKVLRQYPNSPRVAPALVRISHSLSALGSAQEAKQYFDVAMKAYPGHPCLDWPAPSMMSSSLSVSATRTPASTVASGDGHSATHGRPGESAGRTTDLEVSPMEPSAASGIPARENHGNAGDGLHE